MPTVSVYVDVDVDLDDFETEDLIDEIEKRGENRQFADPNDLQKMFMALATGNEQEALNLLRKYLCDALGRVL